ncbi:Microtubule-Associated Tumor Suppressor 1 [Manis pentadactyla]|nr:Microtubule-Associated Tumor Suppressor 1 [Manis pentadactyla]
MGEGPPAPVPTRPGLASTSRSGSGHREPPGGRRVHTELAALGQAPNRPRAPFKNLSRPLPPFLRTSRCPALLQTGALPCVNAQASAPPPCTRLQGQVEPLATGVETLDRTWVGHLPEGACLRYEIPRGATGAIVTLTFVPESTVQSLLRYRGRVELRPASFPSLEAAVSPPGSPLCLAEPWHPGLGMPAKSV